MLDTYEQHSKRKLIATVLAVIVIAGAVVFADHMKKSSDTVASTNTVQTTTPTATTDTTTTTPAAPTATSAYKDGTYSASSSYYVPQNQESIQVSVTLKNGVVSNVSIVNSQGDRESAEYQSDFTNAYTKYVVGKSISGLKLGIVAGASDTTEGFNDAIAQIATKAQA